MKSYTASAEMTQEYVIGWLADGKTIELMQAATCLSERVEGHTVGRGADTIDARALLRVVLVGMVALDGEGRAFAQAL